MTPQSEVERKRVGGAVTDLIAQLGQTRKTRTPALRGLGNPPPQAPLRRRVGSDQGPIAVAEPTSQGGPFNVLLLLDRPGRVEQTVDAVVDRVGPRLGRLVLCAPLAIGSKWAQVGATVQQLRAFTQGTPFGALVAFGLRDETVAVEACEGDFRLVVDLSEDAQLRRTLKMCAVAYVVGPQGVARFAEDANRRPRLLTPPRDADRSDWIRRAI